MSRVLAQVAGKLLTMLGYDGTDFRNLHVDAAGDLQVDVLTTAINALAATAANQATMITALELIDDLRAALNDVGTDELRVLAGKFGASWKVLTTDAAGDLQVDVLSSALPDGAATSAWQDTLNDGLVTIHEILPTGGKWKKANASVNVPDGAWTTIKEVTVPANKIAYWMSFVGGMAFTADVWFIRLYEGAGYFYEGYVGMSPLTMDIGLLSRRTAGQTFKVSAQQNTGAAKWISVTMLYIEVDA